jgi:hypothetical protein
MVLFGAAGEIVAISNTLAPEEFKYLNEAREVMASGKGIEIARTISGEDYFSMILPLQVKDRRTLRRKLDEYRSEDPSFEL